MEKYVCSLELAKRLKELGVRQESEFYWLVNDMTRLVQFIGSEYGEYYSAFTVGELGEKLPNYICSYRDRNTWFCNPKFERFTKTKLGTIADTEADARAKMYCYLLENKLVEVRK